ncbi:hypothetical protein BGX33_012582 [Mortierella sp. NVP41]|nr:hypothetical protein BGX33_012582 [Mortierella sp. NVP41]
MGYDPSKNYRGSYKGKHTQFSHNNKNYNYSSIRGKCRDPTKESGNNNNNHNNYNDSRRYDDINSSSSSRHDDQSRINFEDRGYNSRNRGDSWVRADTTDRDRPRYAEGQENDRVGITNIRMDYHPQGQGHLYPDHRMRSSPQQHQSSSLVDQQASSPSSAPSFKEALPLRSRWDVLPTNMDSQTVLYSSPTPYGAFNHVQNSRFTTHSTIKNDCQGPQLVQQQPALEKIVEQAEPEDKRTKLVNAASETFKVVHNFRKQSGIPTSDIVVIDIAGKRRVGRPSKARLEIESAILDGINNAMSEMSSLDLDAQEVKGPTSGKEIVKHQRGSEANPVNSGLTANRPGTTTTATVRPIRSQPRAKRTLKTRYERGVVRERPRAKGSLSVKQTGPHPAQPREISRTTQSRPKELKRARACREIQDETDDGVDEYVESDRSNGSVDGLLGSPHLKAFRIKQDNRPKAESRSGPIARKRSPQSQDDDSSVEVKSRSPPSSPMHRERPIKKQRVSTYSEEIREVYRPFESPTQMWSSSAKEVTSTSTYVGTTVSRGSGSEPSREEGANSDLSRSPSVEILWQDEVLAQGHVDDSCLDSSSDRSMPLEDKDATMDPPSRGSSSQRPFRVSNNDLESDIEPDSHGAHPMEDRTCQLPAHSSASPSPLTTLVIKIQGHDPSPQLSSPQQPTPTASTPLPAAEDVDTMQVAIAMNLDPVPTPKQPTQVLPSPNTNATVEVNNGPAATKPSATAQRKIEAARRRVMALCDAMPVATPRSASVETHETDHQKYPLTDVFSEAKAPAEAAQMGQASFATTPVYSRGTHHSSMHVAHPFQGVTGYNTYGTYGAGSATSQYFHTHSQYTFIHQQYTEYYRQSHYQPTAQHRVFESHQHTYGWHPTPPYDYQWSGQQYIQYPYPPFQPQLPPGLPPHLPIVLPPIPQSAPAVVQPQQPAAQPVKSSAESSESSPMQVDQVEFGVVSEKAEEQMKITLQPQLETDIVSEQVEEHKETIPQPQSESGTLSEQVKEHNETTPLPDSPHLLSGDSALLDLITADDRDGCGPETVAPPEAVKLPEEFGSMADSGVQEPPETPVLSDQSGAVDLLVEIVGRQFFQLSKQAMDTAGEGLYPRNQRNFLRKYYKGTDPAFGERYYKSQLLLAMVEDGEIEEAGAEDGEIEDACKLDRCIMLIRDAEKVDWDKVSLGMVRGLQEKNLQESASQFTPQACRATWQLWYQCQLDVRKAYNPMRETDESFRRRQGLDTFEPSSSSSSLAEPARYPSILERLDVDNNKFELCGEWRKGEVEILKEAVKEARIKFENHAHAPNLAEGARDQTKINKKHGWDVDWEGVSAQHLPWRRPVDCSLIALELGL